MSRLLERVAVPALVDMLSEADLRGKVSAAVALGIHCLDDTQNQEVRGYRACFRACGPRCACACLCAPCVFLCATWCEFAIVFVAGVRVPLPLVFFCRHVCGCGC